MAPNPRAVAAFRAMKVLGLKEDQVKPVLKKLYKLYDKNWELIEEENYRVLADAIFEEQDAKVPDQSKCRNDEEGNFGEEALVHEEPVRPLKRLRLRGQEGQASSSSPANYGPRLNGTLLKRPKLEDEELPTTPSKQQEMAKPPQPNVGNTRTDSGALSPQYCNRNMGKQPLSPKPLAPGHKGKEPFSPQDVPREKRCSSEKPAHGIRINEPIIDQGIVLLPNKVTDAHALIMPKEEPVTDDFPHYEVPIVAIHPEPPGKVDSSVRKVSMGTSDSEKHSASLPVEGENRVCGVLASSSERTDGGLASIPEETQSVLEIVSLPMGEVKISVSCTSSLRGQNFLMPTVDELNEMMEEKYLRSYKIIDPKFSVMNLMKDVCECFLELATNSSHESQEGLTNIAPSLELKNATVQDALGQVVANEENINIPNGSTGIRCSADVATPPNPIVSTHGFDGHHIIMKDHSDNGTEFQDSNMNNSSSLVVAPKGKLTGNEFRFIHDVTDISKGEERVEISWVNEINNECPPSFHYISQSLVFQNACVNISLSRIGDENCCSACFGDCLLVDIPCACASETGCIFAYTSEGLLKKDVLEGNISRVRDPQHQKLLFCRQCPLERSRNDDILESCKGHLQRKFIKECWSKCGCKKQCGNRIVQQGLRCKLQVFFTPDGKGWGLRTLEKLPKGAFVCEYAGEILTISELYERKMQDTNTAKHSSPVLLDAYWSSCVSKDEEALCLDATCYGNVARFINHRCFDANLIEIPIEVETPERHYYHLAFFTMRDVDALEELTWDYGIDFDDHDHPVEAFRCQCGSKFCRNMKRSSRSRFGGHVK